MKPGRKPEPDVASRRLRIAATMPLCASHPWPQLALRSSTMPARTRRPEREDTDGAERSVKTENLGQIRS